MASLHHLSDEVILKILEYLSPKELTCLSAVDRHLARLAADPQIWKRLFVRHFIDGSCGTDPATRKSSQPRRLPTLSSLRSLIELDRRTPHQDSTHTKPPHHGKPKKLELSPRWWSDDPSTEDIPSLEAAPWTPSRTPAFLGLPSRYRPSHSTGGNINSHVERNDKSLSLELEDVALRNDDLDWPALYRVQHNWQLGHFLIDRLMVAEVAHVLQLPAESVSSSEPKIGTTSAQSSSVGPTRPDTLVQASRHSNLIFTASRSAGTDRVPTVQVFHSAPVRDASKGQTGVRSYTSLVHTTPVCLLRPDVETCASLLDSARIDHVTLAITEIRLDEAQQTGGVRERRIDDSKVGWPGATERLLVCYSTGAWVVFSVHESMSKASRTVSGAQECKYDSRQVYGAGANTHETSTSTSSRNGDDHVVFAAFNSLLLCTVTAKFTIRLFHLKPLWPSASRETGLDPIVDAQPSSFVTLLQELRTFACHWPASVRLTPIPFLQRPSSGRGEVTGAPDHLAYRLSVVFSAPSYPSTWSVGLQEMLVVLPQQHVSSHSTQTHSTAARPIVTSRFTTAAAPFIRTPIDALRRSVLPQPPFDTSSPSSSPRHQRHPMSKHFDAIPRSENKIVSITNDDGPFVVVGRADNLVEIFEVHGAARAVGPAGEALSTASLLPISRHASRLRAGQESSGLLSDTRRLPPLAEPLLLRHQQVMYGHTGAVSSVALEDGRCVSGATDGCVMVWALGNRSSSNKRDAEHDAGATKKRPRHKDDGDGDSSDEDPESALDRIFGPPATPKRIRAEMGDEEDKVAHVLTLRTPILREFEEKQASKRKGKARAEDDTANMSLQHQPSLSQSSSTDADQVDYSVDTSDVADQAPAIRWVGTGFDRIVSVSVPSLSSKRGRRQGEGSCGQEARKEAEECEREAVQVWSFAG